MFARIKDECFCAFCKSSRYYYSKKHIDFVNVTVVLVMAVLITTGLWTWWDPRGIGIVVLGLGLAEAFVYLRWRFSVICTSCGFDPVLYMSAPDRASARVRAFYDKKVVDPKFMLSNSPLLEFHREVVKRRSKNEFVQERTKTPVTKELAKVATPKDLE